MSRIFAIFWSEMTNINFIWWQIISNILIDTIIYWRSTRDYYGILEIDELAEWGSGGDGVILGQGPGGEVGPLVRGSTQLGQGRWTLALWTW